MKRTIGPQFVPIPMPMVSTVDERAHHKRGYQVKDPGVGGVSAGCNRADPPPNGPNRGAIQTPTETPTTGFNLLRSTPSIIADVAGIFVAVPAMLNHGAV